MSDNPNNGHLIKRIHYPGFSIRGVDQFPKSSLFLKYT